MHRQLALYLARGDFHTGGPASALEFVKRLREAKEDPLMLTVRCKL
jgi:hypothetical protein